MECEMLVCVDGEWVPCEEMATAYLEDSDRVVCSDHYDLAKAVTA